MVIVATRSDPSCNYLTMPRRSAAQRYVASVTPSRRPARVGQVIGVRRLGGLALALAGLAGGYLLAPAVLPATLSGRVAASTASERDANGRRGAPALAGESVAPLDKAAAAAATPAAGLAKADVRAGLLSTKIVADGGGALAVVPGNVAGPGRGPVRSVRVEVESGLPVDGEAFAAFVMSTLNDPRSWGVNGRMTFSRTDGAAEIRVVLASPATVDRICAPVATKGVLSCGHDGVAALNFTRWVQGIKSYGGDWTAYRQYLVNHEVGHLLGYPHVECPGAGQRAPVMQQQTAQVAPCTPNAWPYPDGA